MTFALDPRLERDTEPFADWPLCAVRLMLDARFPWIVLVPRRPGLMEPFDLPPSDLERLWRETSEAARQLKTVTGAHKINIGALGNIVHQLHVHVVARREGDPAWPGPVWGSGPARPYAQDEHAAVRRLLASLTPP
jgi:diadenosine tetraphosphate (Ap4A) HIT family hydrolase